MKTMRGMKVALLAAVVLAAVGMAACGGAKTEPATETETEIEAAPTTSAPAMTTDETSPSEAPAPNEAGALIITAPPNAIQIGFDPTELDADAGAPLTIAFDNQDSGIPHNVEIHKGDANGEVVFAPKDNATVTGPGKADYTVPALDAGTYTYVCYVHPTTMTGTLTIS